MIFEPRCPLARTKQRCFGEVFNTARAQIEVYKLILRDTHRRNKARFFQCLGEIAVHVQDL